MVYLIISYEANFKLVAHLCFLKTKNVYWELPLVYILRTIKVINIKPKQLRLFANIYIHFLNNLKLAINYDYK